MTIGIGPSGTFLYNIRIGIGIGIGIGVWQWKHTIATGAKPRRTWKYSCINLLVTGFAM